MTHTLIVQDEHGEREVLLTGLLTVGRDARCHITSSDTRLSRRHAEFILDGDRVLVRDLESRNGIRVNGRRVPEAQLQSSDEVRIAHLSVRYRAGGGAPGANTTEAEGKTIVRTPGGQGVRPKPLPIPARPAPVAPAPSRTPRRSAGASAWGTRVSVLIVGLSLAVFLVTASALQWWQGHVLDSVAAARATSLAQWLAADVAATVARGAALTAAADAVGSQPGVSAALVLGLEGQVLAPAARVTESYPALPAFGAAPSEILAPRTSAAGGLTEVAIPVVIEGERVAVAWIIFRSSRPPEAGSAAGVLGPAFVLALGAGLLVAMVIRRSTLQALARLNEDVGLVLAGQLDCVRDPLGARPSTDIAESMNYLIDRVRSASDGAITTPDGSPDTPARESASVAPPSSEQPHAQPATPREAHAAWFEMNAQFRVTAVSPACARLLGIEIPALVGHHLIDAPLPKALSDVLLACIGRLTPGTREAGSAEVPAIGRVAASVHREAANGPILVDLRLEDPVV